MFYKKRILFGVFVLAVVLLLHVVLSGQWITLEQLQVHRLYLQELVAQRYLLCVVGYLVLFIAATVFGVPITVLLTVAAGYFFGVVPGVVYANIGATVGAAISFLTFRYFLGSFVQKRYGTQLRQFNQNIEAYGHNYLLTMQILPVTPTLLINVFAGLTTIRLWTFLWTTSVGIAPGSLLYVLAGRQLADMRSLGDFLSISWLILLFILALFSVSPVIFGSWWAKLSPAKK